MTWKSASAKGAELEQMTPINCVFVQKSNLEIVIKAPEPEKEFGLPGVPWNIDASSTAKTNTKVSIHPVGSKLEKKALANWPLKRMVSPAQMVVGRVRITKVSVKTTATNFIIFGFRQDIKFDILNILVSSFFFSFG
jgi:hypothetical protein